MSADYAEIYDRVHAGNEGYQQPEGSPGLILVRQNEARLRREGPRHVDLGCGAGFVVEQMRAWGFDSVGADVSPHAVGALNARLGDGSGVLMADGRAPFPDHSFDLVTCFDVLEHLDREDIPALHAEMMRLLKPGGALFCNISLRPAASVDHEGVNLHRTVEPAEWWQAEFGFDEYTVFSARRDMSCWKRASAEPAAPTRSTLEEFLDRHGDTIAGFRRRDDIALVLETDGVGVELGVAEGRFSEKILSRSSLAHLYSIDMWAGDRGHDVEEYKRALRRLEPYRDRNTTLKLRFDEALGLFPDAYFDFIYVDGYAHTGEDGGRTFEDWWPKCRSGGVFAGDDYHGDFPLVVEAVDRFVTAHGLRRFVIDPVEKADDWASQYPTWFVIKP